MRSDVDRDAAIEAAARALLDALDLPGYGDGAVARMRAIAATRDEVIEVSEACDVLRRALET